MKLFSKACIVLALFVLVGCGGGGNGGDSGGESASSDGETKTVMQNGTITSLDAGAKKVTVKVDGEEKEYTIGESTAILNKMYQEMAFDSLEVDQEIGIEVEKGGETPKKINIVK